MVRRDGGCGGPGDQARAGGQRPGRPSPERGSPAALQVLDLSENELTGPIPAELGQLTAGCEPQLSGPIPAELGQLGALMMIALVMNQLSGPIPVELGQLGVLTVLSLGNNQISGPVPAELGQLGALTNLYLHYNN